MDKVNQEKTLRLLFPQWQGGNNPPYYLGAHLLNWLAPESQGPFEEVPVADPNSIFEVEDNIFGKESLINQAKSAKEILEKHNPDKIVLIGGDCSAALVPFTFINQKYDNDVAILWIDSHPDVDQPEQFANHHAHVVSNLIGIGDKDFLEIAPNSYDPKDILYLGLNTISETQDLFLKKHKLKSIPAGELDGEKVLDWLKSTKKTKVMINIDLDVLDLREFRSLLIANPETYKEMASAVPKGSSMGTITDLIQEVAENYEVVGLGITEHFPWDAYFLKNMLAKLPLIGDINNKDKANFNWIF